MSTTIFFSNEKLNLEKFPLNNINSNINNEEQIIKNSNTMKPIKNKEKNNSNINITLSKDNNINTNIVKKKSLSLNKEYNAKSPQPKRTNN